MTSLERLLLLRADEQASAVKPADFRVTSLAGLTDAEKRARLNAQKAAHKRKRKVWTFETFHAPACRQHLQDPGARCICRDWAPEVES